MQILAPQSGFQTMFTANEADILIGGGSAGGGKTFALLLDPLRYMKIKGFGAVTFRRTTPQIRNEGGLWDTSSKIYQRLGATPREQALEWCFRKYGSSFKFSHLEHEKNKYDWQGSQLPWIGFDELTHFSETQFFYMLSRNRSVLGFKPCIRAGCNPDPDSWVAEFLEWWIDQETGFPIPERNGKIRYFARMEGKMIWGDSKQEIIDGYSDYFAELASRADGLKPEDFIKSVSFVRGDVYGNHELLSKDPNYLANLMALDETEKRRLLDGNWKIRTDGKSLFQFDKIQNLFSNFIAEEQNPERIITCDVATGGKDLFVAMLWVGWKVVRICILTKSDTPENIEEIEKLRAFGGVGKSNVLVDQGGVGEGTVSVGGYKGFSSNAPVREDPVTRVKENYDMLKTQCAYRMANKVNNGQVAIAANVEIYVDGERAENVKVGGKLYSVKKLITDDLRSFKRCDDELDRKKKIESKDKQKATLAGRSPDCGDTFIMREAFEFQQRVRIIV